jgi:hypothetical protein
MPQRWYTPDRGLREYIENTIARSDGGASSSARLDWLADEIEPNDGSGASSEGTYGPLPLNSVCRIHNTFEGGTIVLPDGQTDGDQILVLMTLNDGDSGEGGFGADVNWGEMQIGGIAPTDNTLYEWGAGSWHAVSATIQHDFSQLFFSANYDPINLDRIGQTDTRGGAKVLYGDGVWRDPHDDFLGKVFYSPNGHSWTLSVDNEGNVVAVDNSVGGGA